MSDKTLNNSWFGINILALTSYFSGVTRSGLGRVLLSRFLVLSLVPMAFVGWVSEQRAIEIIEKNQHVQLNTIALVKSNQLNDYFTGLVINLRLQAELDNTVRFVEELVDGYEESNRSLKDFTVSFYWANLEDQYAQDLFNFLSTYSYIDILLLDTKGNVLYSIRRDDELGTNLFTGKYAKTKFSRAAKKSLKTGVSTYSDIEFYEPYNNSISSFMVQTVIDEYGDSIGLLAIHISQSQIKKIMGDKTGMGESGESYLVGIDKLMRTESLYIEPSVLNVSINTSEVDRWLDSVNSEQALSGQTLSEQALSEGELSYIGYRGERKLGVSHQVGLADVSMLMLVEIDEEEAYLPAARLINIIIGIILFTAIVVCVVALISARNITRPIVQLTEWAEKLSIGSLSQQDIVTPNNEIGILNRAFTELVKSMQEITWVLESFSVGDLTKKIKPRCASDVMVVAINQLSDSMESVVQQAREVASGEYALEFKVRGERDVLGNALENMTAALREATLENESQNWSKTGLAGLSEKMRGDLNLSKLSEEVIDYICKHVSARVGVIYVINDEGLLVCTGGYALDLMCAKKQEYSIGQGLIGQCAKDREIIVIKNVPQNYMQVESGLGSARPLEIILVPLIYNNNIYGVVELGFLNAVRQIDINFLSTINESIAISIHTVFSRLKIDQTLFQVQEKSEALQAQQEELKASNEELEEQTQLLRQSEEELKATNEELEEKSSRLKIQKEAIEKKSIEVEEKAADLAAASKYKSEFLANMSHELRTPLNSLLILAKLLKDNKENNLSRQQVEWARVISNSGADLLELINDILVLSKVEAGKLDVDIETVSLETLVESLEDKFRPVADDKGVEFVVEKKLKTIHEVQSDRKRLGQILKNMLSNAVKFTAKGQIKLSIYHPEKNIQLTKAHLKPDNCIALSVSDTGIGIKQEKLDAIFSAFQQADGSTSRKYGGTGLGLSISRELSHLLGGEITVESKVGEGSKFILYLPYDYASGGYANSDYAKGDCAKGDYARGNLAGGNSAKSTSNVMDIADGRKERLREDHASVEIVSSIERFIADDHVIFTKNKKSVLIIEDNKDFATSLLELVRQHDFIGLVAGDGRSAMKMANEYRPTAILLDLGLPDMRGEDVLKYVKENVDTRHIPVHIISGKEEEDKYVQPGAIGFLTKPVDEKSIKELFVKINEIIDNESKNILLVEDDEDSSIAISSLLTNEYTNVITAANVKTAKEIPGIEKIDCLLIDLGLPNSFEISFIEELKEKAKDNCPVIIHTGKNLSNKDLEELNKTADSVIIKGDKSRERLLDETMLFLHHVESKLPQSQRSVISYLHNVEVFFKDKYVLMVDDDMRNLFALSGVLSEYDMHIVMAENGQDALDKLEETPQIDLVLMDIMMPVMDGYEAMGRIRENKKTAEIPIIALTAKAMPADRLKCINAGASDYLAKPIDTDKLLSLMRVWMHK